MIKSFVAFTDEIDDSVLAAAEISKQISGGITLCKNTVGLINCHTEFLETGAFGAICSALPFPTFGFTTSINGGGPANEDNFGEGDLHFTMLVLTSDDTSFEIGVTEKIIPRRDYEEQLKPALVQVPNCSGVAGSGAGKTANAESEATKNSDNAKKPALVMVAVPSINVIPGDDLVRAFDKCLPGVPLFGGFAVDDSPRYDEDVFALANGGIYIDSVVFLKVYGDVKPLFYSASISKDKVNPRSAIVTKSKGTEIITLNDRPVTEYIQSLGLSDSLLDRGVVTNFALIIENDEIDGFNARAMLRFSPERTLICGGDVPEGSIIHMGELEKGDMINAGRTAAYHAVSNNANALLALSSISRATILGSDIFHGIDTVRKLTGEIPFIMGYVAGEISPDTSGKNRFNNQSFNACVI
jgi:hypothetical protein